jgi:hypothetical protein
MGAHIGTYLFRQEKGIKANDYLIANPFKIDFFFRSQEVSLVNELLKINSTLLYSSNEFELGLNLGVLAVIGRHFEVVLGKSALLKMYLVTSAFTTLCFIPGILKNNLINMNSSYNKYTSTFALSLCSTYYFVSFLGLTSVKVGCLGLYLYLIYMDTNYDVTVGLISGAFLSVMLKRKFFL